MTLAPTLRAEIEHWLAQTEARLLRLLAEHEDTTGVLTELDNEIAETRERISDYRKALA